MKNGIYDVGGSSCHERGDSQICRPFPNREKPNRFPGPLLCQLQYQRLDDRRSSNPWPSRCPAAARQYGKSRGPVFWRLQLQRQQQHQQMLQDRRF